MGRRTIRAFLAVAAIAVALVAARPADAHPLGNFTINHYAGITVAPEEVRLDVVIDLAEIPTFQERQRIDTDGDGTVSDAEAAAAEAPACAERAKSLRLSVGGSAVTPEPTTAAISFPSGLGGLSTMRIECGYVARPRDAHRRRDRDRLRGRVGRGADRLAGDRRDRGRRHGGGRRPAGDEPVEAADGLSRRT